MDTELLAMTRFPVLAPRLRLGKFVGCWVIVGSGITVNQAASLVTLPSTLVTITR
jgi:hypothetical protein